MLPLYYTDSLSDSLEVAKTLYKAGIRAIEYTNRGAHALANFTELKKAAVAGMPGLWMGIGTVKTVADARSFMDAGADFMVSPIVNPAVAALAEKEDMLWIPGCMTPTEINLAQEHRAALIKIFPANILGPEFLSSIRDLFQGQLFMPTGGVELDLDNIRSWFKAGVCAVGMGSKLITKDVLKNKDYEGLYKNTLKALELVREGRKI